MNDKELLELAARAAGIDGDYSKRANSIVHPDGYWNPLADDGDALRLASAVGIDICFYEDRVETWKAGMPAFEIEPFNGDRAAATRRAITRAAAEIGRKM